ncbi:hypothetical protein D3C76_1610370 [compost metagenome]
MEAAGIAQMAGRANRIDQNQQRVVITVWGDAHYVEEVARAFALGPQALLGTREEGDLAALLGSGQRFLVHVAEHQHFAGNGMLYNRRQQVVSFFPVELASLLFC